MIITGGLVAFPTETVYGLGANVFDEDAVAAIFKAKGRPSDNPLIVHVAKVEQINAVARRIPVVARKLISAFFPGPLTVVLPKRAEVPDVATAGLDTVGVRMPAHPLARKFLLACGVPVAAPSANRSGRPSPTSWQATQADLAGRIDFILQGSRATVGLESTVVDCTGRAPVVLRPGAVTLDQLKSVVPGVRPATPRDIHRGRSPGLKHRHYAPEAKVFLLDESSRLSLRGKPGQRAFIGLRPPREIEWGAVKRCRDVEDYAREVFHFFRACDASGVRMIYCESVAERGLGVALMDRLRRAARR